MSQLITRPFQQSDYSRLRSLWNAAYPDSICTTTGLMIDDGQRNPSMMRWRRTALVNSSVVGVGAFEHWKEFFHPDEYLVHLLVEPERQGKGIEDQLYSDLLSVAEGQKPLLLRALVRENYESLQKFLIQKGFTRSTIRRFIYLDLKTCDLTPFEELKQQFSKTDFRFFSFSDLRNDSQRSFKLYNLYSELIEDIHNPKPTQLSYEEYLTDIEDAEMEQMSWVALENNECVGQITLRPNQVTNQLYIEIMGVTRPYRRSKVGLALLLYAIGQARMTDYAAVTAHTDWQNGGTISLAKMLGFTFPISHVHYVKKLAEDTGQE